MSRRHQNREDKRRTDLRNELWPGSDQWIWDPGNPEVVGFATVPRLLPLILHLLKILSNSRAGDPSSVYLDLWCRDFGQGFIEIDDEQDAAYAAGYTGERAVRTWKERMKTLQDLRFILAKEKHGRAFRLVLLQNPIAVCAQHNNDGKVPEGWWTTFSCRAKEIGATIPPRPVLSETVPACALPVETA